MIAQILDAKGVVLNTIVAERDFLDAEHKGLWREVPVVPVVALPAALPDISDRQFGEGLWRNGLIAFEDYLAFVGPGVIPPPLKALLDRLPDDDTGKPTPRKVALGLVTGAQSFQFDNPLVDLIRQAQGWTVATLRERWAAWAIL